MNEEEGIKKFADAQRIAEAAKYLDDLKSTSADQQVFDTGMAHVEALHDIATKLAGDRAKEIYGEPE